MSEMNPASSSKQIILAEDDQALRELLASTLRRRGHAVVELEDGNELLEYVARHLRANGSIADVDLIVSDIRMPEFTGMDVAVGLRRVLAETPMILITAFGDAQTHDFARAVGVTALLDKPFDLDEFLAVVDRALARRG